MGAEIAACIHYARPQRLQSDAGEGAGHPTDMIGRKRKKEKKRVQENFAHHHWHSKYGIADGGSKEVEGKARRKLLFNALGGGRS